MEDLHLETIKDGRAIVSLKVIPAEDPTDRHAEARRSERQGTPDDIENTPARSRLFVSLPRDTHARAFEEEVAQLDDVESITTGLIASKGIAYIKFRTTAAAQRARDDLEKHSMVAGKRVSVCIAEPKARQSSVTPTPSHSRASISRHGSMSGIGASAHFSPSERMGSSDNSSLDCNPAFWGWLTSQGVQACDVAAAQKWHVVWQRQGCPGSVNSATHFGQSSARNSVTGQHMSGMPTFAGWDEQYGGMHTIPEESNRFYGPFAGLSGPRTRSHSSLSGYHHPHGMHAMHHTGSADPYSSHNAIFDNLPPGFSTSNTAPGLLSFSGTPSNPTPVDVAMAGCHMPHGSSGMNLDAAPLTQTVPLAPDDHSWSVGHGDRPAQGASTADIARRLPPNSQALMWPSAPQAHGNNNNNNNALAGGARACSWNASPHSSNMSRQTPSPPDPPPGYLISSTKGSRHLLAMLHTTDHVNAPDLERLLTLVFRQFNGFEAIHYLTTCAAQASVWFLVVYSLPKHAENARALAADPKVVGDVSTQLAVYFCAPDPSFVPELPPGLSGPVAKNTRSNTAKMLALNRAPQAMTEDASGESHFTQAALSSDVTAGGAAIAASAAHSCGDSDMPQADAWQPAGGWPQASPTVVMFHLSSTLPEYVLQGHFERYGAVGRVQLHPKDNKWGAVSFTTTQAAADMRSRANPDTLFGCNVFCQPQ